MNEILAEWPSQKGLVGCGATRGRTGQALGL